ncbi:MAG: hypothetical protein V3T81_05935, partial [Thermoanaerobaculia bacterium]
WRPMVAAIVSLKQGRKLSDREAVIGVEEAHRQEILCDPALLGLPARPSIQRGENRALRPDYPPVARVDKEDIG